MKKQGTTDAKRAAANDQIENGTDKAKVTNSLRMVAPEPEEVRHRQALTRSVSLQMHSLFLKRG